MKPVKRHMMDVRNDVRGFAWRAVNAAELCEIERHQAHIWITVYPLFRDGLELLNGLPASSLPEWNSV